MKNLKITAAFLLLQLLIILALVFMHRAQEGFITHEDLQFAQWFTCVKESDGSDESCAACDAKYNPAGLDFWAQ